MVKNKQTDETPKDKKEPILEEHLFQHTESNFFSQIFLCINENHEEMDLVK